MTTSYTRLVWAFIGCLLFSLATYTVDHAGDLQSVICAGMPYRSVRPLIEKEELQVSVVACPKDPVNWKRYQFSEAYSLLLVLKWSPVGRNSDVRHLILDEIWLMPTNLVPGTSSWPLKANLVDLKSRAFRTHGV